MSAAKDTLENKKKWVRMPFDQGDSRQADNKLKDFENTFSNSRSTLDAAYIQQTEQYIEGLRKELALLTITEEYNGKVNSWRSILRRVETFVADHDINRGPCSSINDFNRVSTEIEATIVKSELMVCKDLKTFADDWKNTLKPTIARKIAELEIKGEFNDLETPLAGAVRSVDREISNLSGRSNYTNPNENLERAVQTAQTAIGKVDMAKWGTYEPAKKLIKDAEDKIEQAYKAMGKAAPSSQSSAATPAPASGGTPKGLQCRKGHLLDKQPARGCNCDVCSRQATGSFTCKTCDYDMCFACAEKATPPTTPPVSVASAAPARSTPTPTPTPAPAPTHKPAPASTPTPTPAASDTIPDGLQCSRGHLLEKNAARNCNCDVCRRSATGSLSCKPCDYDMCFNCAKKATPPKTAPVSTAAPAARSLPSAPTPTPTPTPTPAPAPASSTSYSSSTSSSSSAPSTAAYNPQQDTMESKKRYLRMTFDSGQSGQCESKVKDFEASFNNLRSQLPPGYVKETEKYIEDIKKELAVIVVSDEYNNKVSGWKSQLSRIENIAKDYNPGNGHCNSIDDFARISGEVEAVVNRQELMVCKDLKAFVDQWKATDKEKYSKLIHELGLRIEWYFVQSPIAGWLRPLERDIEGTTSKNWQGFSNPIDNLQATAESAQIDLDKLDRAKWASYAPAQELIKKIEGELAKAYAAMGKADAAKKAAKAAQEAAQDKALEDKINAAPKDIATALSAGKCTYSVTGAKGKRQPYFSCQKCGNNYALCISCKRNGDHPPDHTLVLSEGEAYCSCAHAGKCKTSGHAAAVAAVSVASSSYSTSTFELWMLGTGEKPIGHFDCTNRQLKLDLRNTLLGWNKWVDDFNNKWEEFLKQNKEMKEANDDQWEWHRNQVDGDLKSASDVTKYFRSQQTQIAAEAPGKDQHPAVKVIEGEIKRSIEMVRDARDALDEYTEGRKFTIEAEGIVQNARLAYEEATKEHSNAVYKIHIDNYRGEDHKFDDYSNSSSGYFLHDVLRVALLEAERAKKFLASSPRGKTHPLAAEVEKIIKDSKAAQEPLCVKWSTKFAAESDTKVAKRFRDALQKTLGDVPALKQLDKQIQDADAKVAKERKEQEDKDKIQAEKERQALQAESARMKAAWLTPYTGGKVYCDKEEWTYHADGTCTNGNIKLEFDGTYIEGSTRGAGEWGETTMQWRYNNRSMYLFKYDSNAKEYVPFDQNTPAVTFKWDGAILMPKQEAWLKRNVRFDGKVPVPVLLAIAMRPHAEKRIVECDGSNLCKSALFNEGVQMKTCKNCSSNSTTHCVVCRDRINFPKIPGKVCKNCVSQVSSSCVKCKANFPEYPAFICDSCRSSWNDRCIRTTQF